MAKAQLFIFACVASLTSASIADETVSLIQRDSKIVSLSQKDSQLKMAAADSQLKVAATASDSSCECLGWKDAYTKHGASCGDGHELDLAGIPGPIAKMIPQLSFEFCNMYFDNLPNDRYCMNKKWVANPTEWCYVPAGCTEGTPISNRTLATKDCNKEADATLGEMKFEELAAYAYKNKLELGLMVQYAFPTWDGEKLPDVQAFWGLPPPADAKPISAELRERLEAQVKSGKIMFFVSRNGHPPFGVSEGEKLYYINFNPTHADFSHKEDMNLWGCVAGCGSENKALW